MTRDGSTGGHAPGNPAPGNPEVKGFAPLARIAFRIADPHTATVADAIDAALRSGEDASRIAEAILQGIPYSGFPGAVEALGTLREQSPGFTPLPPVGTSTSEAGEGDVPAIPPTFRAIYRDGSEAVRGALAARHPELARWILGFAYGTVMERGILTLAELEGLAVASLVGQRRRTPLHSHIRGALRNGWTAAALGSLLDTLADEADRETLAFARAVITREG